MEKLLSEMIILSLLMSCLMVKLNKNGLGFIKEHSIKLKKIKSKYKKQVNLSLRVKIIVYAF